MEMLFRESGTCGEEQWNYLQDIAFPKTPVVTEWRLVEEILREVLGWNFEWLGKNQDK